MPRFVDVVDRLRRDAAQFLGRLLAATPHTATALARFGLLRLLSSAHFLADERARLPPALLSTSDVSDAMTHERVWLRRAVVAQTLALAAQVPRRLLRRRCAHRRPSTQMATLPLHDARDIVAWLWQRSVAVRRWRAAALLSVLTWHLRAV